MTFQTTLFGKIIHVQLLGLSIRRRKKMRASESIYWSQLKRLLSLKQAAWADFVVFSG